MQEISSQYSDLGLEDLDKLEAKGLAEKRATSWGIKNFEKWCDKRKAESWLQLCNTGWADIFDFTSWHQFSESQPGWKPTIFIRLACHIYWVQKSCNTTNFLHNSSLSKKAQLQENSINLIIWCLTKAECSLTCSSTVGEKNWYFDHVPYLGIPKYFRLWLYKDRSSSICRV